MSDDWSRRQNWQRGPGSDGEDAERTRVLGPGDRGTEHLPAPGGRVLAGRYRLEQSLDVEAGMEFHQAIDQHDGRPVGVTVFTGRLDQAGARRFLDQARALVAVRHPDLVAVFDVGVERGQGWLVRELVDGWSLRAEVRRGVLPPEEVARIGGRAAAALAEAHDHGLIHRDVSPDTVVLARDGRTRVAELGVLGLSEIAGGPAGAAAYRSPEQVRREPIGPPADVYALGLTLLEALTGRVEYPGGGWEAASARLSRPPGVPNDVPAPLARALLAMTATVPGERPSARASAGILDSAASGGVYAAGAAVAEPDTTSPARRVALIALPVLALLVLIGVVVAATHHDASTGSSAAGATTATTTTPSSARSTRTRTRTPSTNSTDSTGSPDSGFSLPSFTAPALPKASDVEKAVTDKVKDQVQRSLTEKAQDAWKSFTDWLSGLF